MTLVQLNYVLTVAAKGTVSDAARELFITQPSLTNAIKDLEQEIGVTIFHRSNRGITVSKEGETFLGYARQVVEQAQLLEERYLGGKTGKRQMQSRISKYCPVFAPLRGGRKTKSRKVNNLWKSGRDGCEKTARAAQGQNKTQAHRNAVH